MSAASIMPPRKPSCAMYCRTIERFRAIALANSRRYSISCMRSNISMSSASAHDDVERRRTYYLRCVRLLGREHSPGDQRTSRASAAG